jgi:hypothetical protein
MAITVTTHDIINSDAMRVTNGIFDPKLFLSRTASHTAKSKQYMRMDSRFWAKRICCAEDRYFLLNIL